MAARFGAEPKKIIAGTYNTAISLSADGKALVFERTSLTLPAEIFAHRAMAPTSGNSPIRMIPCFHPWR